MAKSVNFSAENLIIVIAFQFNMANNILPKEPQLLKHGKVLPFGIYDDLITQPKTSFWDSDGFLIKRRRNERKAWIFFGVYSEDLYTGLAIVDAGFVATAFTYVFIPSKNLFIEDKTTVPFGFGNGFDPAMTDEWKLGNYRIVSAGNTMQMSYQGKFSLDIVAEINANGFSSVVPSHERPFNFTYKNLPMPVQVQLNVRGEDIRLKGNYGAIDFTKGYPPRSTNWNWTSFIGTTESGKSIAANIVDKFNHNMENILWIDGQKTILSDAQYTLGQRPDKDNWAVKTKDGILDIQFRPFGARSENLNVGIMKSIFIQPFGVMEGTVTLNGQQENFKAYGVMEDHQAVW